MPNHECASFLTLLHVSIHVMAFNNYRYQSAPKTSAYFGFGALGISSVRLKAATETWTNPNLDTKPHSAYHKPLIANNNAVAVDNLYPNLKLTKTKKRIKKKKIRNKPHVLHYFHPDHEDDIDITPTHQQQRTAPTTRKRPFSAHTAGTNKKDIYIGHHPSKSDQSSIQFELMKQHMNQLKQEISNQMKRNDSTQTVMTADDENEADSVEDRTQQQLAQKKPNSKSKMHNKQKKKLKEPIVVPTSPVVVSSTKHAQQHSFFAEYAPRNEALPGSPTRPKHQSFVQRPAESGKVRVVLDESAQHKQAEKKVNSQCVNIGDMSPSSTISSNHRYHKPKKKTFSHLRRRRCVPSRPASHKTPVHIQTCINTVTVGMPSVENRLSSTFASNTPRIFPLNKLMQNPKYQKYQHVHKANSNRKPQLKKPQRPWSCKPVKQKRTNKGRNRRNAASSISKNKPKRRPKSAPSSMRGGGKRRNHNNNNNSNKHDSMQYYMQTIEQNARKQLNDDAMDDESAWNPFVGITMFECEYLVSFLRTKLDEYRISTDTLDVLENCLHFYVHEDSYETAWNAWNIIQKFLLPDTSELDIDKTLCREVLREYQTQSRDLKRNHIEEDLFDDIIQEIGCKIAKNIHNKQLFTVQFEQFVIDSQQQSEQEVQSKTAKPQRPQTAKPAELRTKRTDLMHHANGFAGSQQQKRPQSAFPASGVIETIFENDTEKDCVLNNGKDEEERSEHDKEEIKYCLDGVIDEM